MITITTSPLDIETQLKRVFECQIPLRFADMDADQHVNNAEYYRYMEEARMRWFDQLGLALIPPLPIPVLAANACQFIKPMHFPGTVTVEIYLGAMSKSSLRTHCLLRNGPTIVAEGYAVSVWMDPATQKSIPLPAPIRALSP